MSSAPNKPKTFVKKTERFTDQEINAIAAAHRVKVDAWLAGGKKGERPSVLKADIEHEKTGSAAMTASGVRFLQLLMRDLKGVYRPLIKKKTPTMTASWPRLGKDDGKENKAGGSPPGAADYQTRILTYDPAKLGEIADQRISEQFPDLPDDEFEAQATKQEALLKAEMEQWQAEEFISHEFEEQYSLMTERVKIKWITPPKDKVSVAGHVQTRRNPVMDNEKEVAAAMQSPDGMLPLDEPIIRYKVKFDKAPPHKLWCQVYDITNFSVDPKNPKTRSPPLASTKDPETGRMTPLNGKTIATWLRPKSIVAGETNYQVCLSQNGLKGRIHALDKILLVRQAAKQEGGYQASGDLLSSMMDYGGQYGGEDEPDAPDASAVDSQTTNNVVPGGNRVMSDLERQIQEMEAQ
jgi:hypothetical protein